MPYRQEQFANGETYHVVIRALDNNLLFRDENDYFRMIFSVYEFNDARPVNISIRRRNRIRFKRLQRGAVGATPDVAPMVRHRESHQAVADSDERDKLVERFALKPTIN